MTIIVVSDIHGHADAVGRVSGQLEKADLAIVTGDITHFGGAEEAQGVIEEIGKRCERVLAVPGNCDRHGVGVFLAERGISLDGRYKTIDGFVFAGIGGSLPCPGKTPNEYTEDDFARMLDTVTDTLPSPCDIFVSHQPPLDTACDIASGGGHVGSSSLRRFLQKTAPPLCLCGHIHEAAGMGRIGSTVVANPGPLAAGGYTRVLCNGPSITARIEYVPG